MCRSVVVGRVVFVVQEQARDKKVHTRPSARGFFRVLGDPVHFLCRALCTGIAKEQMKVKMECSCSYVGPELLFFFFRRIAFFCCRWCVVVVSSRSRQHAREVRPREHAYAAALVFAVFLGRLVELRLLVFFAYCEMWVVGCFSHSLSLRVYLCLSLVVWFLFFVCVKCLGGLCRDCVRLFFFFSLYRRGPPRAKFTGQPPPPLHETVVARCVFNRASSRLNDRGPFSFALSMFLRVTPSRATNITNTQIHACTDGRPMRPPHSLLVSYRRLLLFASVCRV